MIIQVLISAGEGQGCPVCSTVKQRLSQVKAALKAHGHKIEIQMFNMDDPGPGGDAAVNFAIDKNLTLVPSTLVGTDIFEMDEFTIDDVVNSVLKQS